MKILAVILVVVVLGFVAALALSSCGSESQTTRKQEPARTQEAIRKP